VGIPKFRAIGKTDDACFIKKVRGKKQHPILCMFRMNVPICPIDTLSLEQETEGLLKESLEQETEGLLKEILS